MCGATVKKHMVKLSSVALVTSAADVAVERDGDGTLLSHNVVMSGPGTKVFHPRR